eukprot:TRINITY_DN16638_c4_g1_i1.p1 TRINITY_DN16638_c4_g1~~TRINITY_DN16638_c4_g1_i1.p1  ORF type:complete len:753 (+),score=121.71 TRINITY_DN16638_c4_g1_i1:88-2346(+)
MFVDSPYCSPSAAVWEGDADCLPAGRWPAAVRARTPPSPPPRAPRSAPPAPIPRHSPRTPNRQRSPSPAPPPPRQRQQQQQQQRGAAAARRAALSPLRTIRRRTREDGPAMRRAGYSLVCLCLVVGTAGLSLAAALSATDGSSSGLAIAACTAAVACGCSCALVWLLQSHAHASDFDAPHGSPRALGVALARPGRPRGTGYACSPGPGAEPCPPPPTAVPSEPPTAAASPPPQPQPRRVPRQRPAQVECGGALRALIIASGGEGPATAAWQCAAALLHAGAPPAPETLRVLTDDSRGNAPPSAAQCAEGLRWLADPLPGPPPPEQPGGRLLFVSGPAAPGGGVRLPCGGTLRWSEAAAALAPLPPAEQTLVVWDVAAVRVPPPPLRYRCALGRGRWEWHELHRTAPGWLGGCVVALAPLCPAHAAPPGVFGSACAEAIWAAASAPVAYGRLLARLRRALRRGGAGGVSPLVAASLPFSLRSRCTLRRPHAPERRRDLAAPLPSPASWAPVRLSTHPMLSGRTPRSPPSQALQLLLESRASPSPTGCGRAPPPAPPAAAAGPVHILNAEESDCSPLRAGPPAPPPAAVPPPWLPHWDPAAAPAGGAAEACPSPPPSPPHAAELSPSSSSVLTQSSATAIPSPASPRPPPPPPEQPPPPPQPPPPQPRAAADGGVVALSPVPPPLRHAAPAPLREPDGSAASEFSRPTPAASLSPRGPPRLRSRSPGGGLCGSRRQLAVGVTAPAVCLSAEPPR